MGRYIGQYSGEVSPGREIITAISANSDKKFIAITDIGIQLDYSKKIYLNGKEFRMSRTGTLEFNDVWITKIHVKHKDQYDTTVIPIIIDYVYTDIEE